MAAVAELDGLLQSMQAMKPPGVSKSKIQAITALCDDNKESESALVSKIFTNFKRTQATHKLGVLYVVDSVTRAWIEKAKKAGQELNGNSAADGTYASGVHRMTELMPTLMNDLYQVIPEDQKEKVQKLLDIWRRSNTFPEKDVIAWKDKLSQQAKPASFTPPGSPPANNMAQDGTIGTQAVRQPDASSILAALANMSKAAPAPQQQQQQQQQFQMPAQMPFSNSPQPHATVNQPSAMPSFPGMPQAPVAAPANSQMQYGSLAGMLQQPPAAPQQPAASAAMASINPQTIGLLQQLVAAGATQDQIAQVLAAVSQQPGALAGLAAPQQPAQMPPAQQQQSSWDQGQLSRDRDTYRSDRNRSRSPDGRGRDGGVRRGSPVYGNSDSRGNEDIDDRRGRNRGHSGNAYRQRTPPPADGGMKNSQPKMVEYDFNLPDGNIKVLSRTLFVGGATGSESELRDIFSRFGVVQTCIVNNDKRHAFVKMATRDGALYAKQSMEKISDPDVLSKARQTRWGVGFGPRDCSDYNTGISIIPISRLTDADRKWMLTAEFGGTGGKPIEHGLVVEEPDIEIGAGVSSKAISRRINPDPGSRRGGFGGGDRGGDRGERRFRGNDRQEPQRQPAQSNQSQQDSGGAHLGAPPAVPNFGMPFAGLNMSGFQ